MENMHLTTDEQKLIAAFRAGNITEMLRLAVCGAIVEDIGGDTQPMPPVLVPVAPPAPVALPVAQVKLPFNWRRPFEVALGAPMGISDNMRGVSVDSFRIPQIADFRLFVGGCFSFATPLTYREINADAPMKRSVLG